MNIAQPHQKNCKILFVDDSLTEINYLKLLFQITDLPAEPIFIQSAQTAIETLSSFEPSDFPNFILVDINMPLMDGFEFAETYVKSFHNKYPNTKLFIYSTSIHSTDIQRAKSIDGVEGFISKPFDENSFNDKILPHLKFLTLDTNSPPKTKVLSS